MKGGAVSGGAYDYLYQAEDLSEIAQRKATLREVADDLAALGYAQDAARETEELLVMLQQWEVRAQIRLGRLERLWKALEWWCSGDGSEERFKQALAEYRGEPGQPEHDPTPRRP